MSELDVQALETNFNNWRKERVPHLSISDAFERYAVEQVLKDADLSDDEIDSGLFGGADDGNAARREQWIQRMTFRTIDVRRRIGLRPRLAALHSGRHKAPVSDGL